MYPPQPHRRLLTDLAEQMRSLYGEMDRAYRAAAAGAGFVCRGCPDNCCESHFYHHTYAEYGYLLGGFSGLPAAVRLLARRRAAAYLKDASAALQSGMAVKSMCPLNDDGRCVLYVHRPMICRLHGIPHELTLPGQPKRTGPGCKAFYSQCGRGGHRPLERTPHYRNLAELEIRLKRGLGLNRKIKLTIAEMLLREPEAGIEGGCRP